MVIDASALVAILEQEGPAGEIATAIEQAPVRRLSAASLLEASIVMAVRRGEDALRELDLLVLKAGIDVIPVTAEQAEVGRRAFLEFGKGRHPASLNLGDCFAYALAITTGSPILCTGTDFRLTDVDVLP